MAGPFLAIAINQSVLLAFANRTYDLPTRMAFFAVLAWVALLLPWRLLKQFQWLFVAGALLAIVKMYVTTRGGTYRGYVDFMPIIEFAQMTQLLGFFALLSIAFEEPNPWLRRFGNTLKIIAGIGGIYAAYLSQTRGAWVGIPVFILVTIIVLMRDLPGPKRLILFVGAFSVVVALFGSTSLVEERIGEVRTDLIDYAQKGNPDTPVGIRLQLWKGSWVLFTEHPLVGVGREQFPAALGDLKQRGIITEAARVQPHSHDELLYNLSTLGIFGGIAILCLYFVPGLYFLRDWRDPDPEIRAIAGMGVILCSGFLILGLSDVMFMWGTSDNFYGIIPAIFFAMIIRRRQYLGDLKGEAMLRANALS
jgi:O-antigen ligase